MSSNDEYSGTVYTILCRYREGAPLTTKGRRRLWTEIGASSFDSAEDAKRAAQAWIDKGSNLEYAIGKVEREIVEVLP